MNELHPYQIKLLLQKSKHEEYLKQLCWMPRHPAESRQKLWHALDPAVSDLYHLHPGLSLSQGKNSDHGHQNGLNKDFFFKQNCQRFMPSRNLILMPSLIREMSISYGDHLYRYCQRLSRRAICT